VRSAKKIEMAISPDRENLYAWRMYNRTGAENPISLSHFDLRVAHAKSSQPIPDGGKGAISVQELNLRVAHA
jgi:hypothetical protein